ncbi:M56 family metallopeptidase [Robiginitalea sp. M366]|uniref:M56 family metallopeptidase n=1 Tax=Robiginitalea aestuariiviva TaxID=3036903 RepID=UPI00240D4119|nr:M56 family metallopeptidase [Robiginitalea aestuariiviva]MDG1572277.1 M56 family metallopeptidase [Robiginitalea aestuariiviva]
MEALGMYLLKASAILGLFYLSYQTYLKRETHFGLNRAYLLAGLAAALVLPLVEFTRTVTLTATAGSQSTASGALQAAEAAPALSWGTYLGWGYLAGAGLGLTLLLWQLWSILRLVHRHRAEPRGKFRYLPSRQVDAPFSFFRYIFYNPDRHQERELELILEHERAHAAAYHSLDILLGRLAAVVLWANPISWWYLKSIQQNLEFLADAHTVARTRSVKAYQYALLRVSAGNRLSPPLVNTFYSSFIKKRILMLQQNQSKSARRLKHLIILPVLGIFLMAFNVRTVYVLEGTPPQAATAEKVLEFVIGKDTSDEQLLEIKAKMAAEGADFSYTTVRNAKGEITGIDLDIKGKSEKGDSFSGTYAISEEEPIRNIVIRINTEGGIFIGEASQVSKKGHTLHLSSPEGDKNTHVWVYKTGDGAEEETIKVHEVSGKNVYFINEEEVDAETLKAGGTAKKILVKLKEIDADSDADIQIHKIHVKRDGESQEIEEIPHGRAITHTVEIREEDGEQVIIMDGKQISEAEFEQMQEGLEEGKVQKIRIREANKDNVQTEVMIMKESDNEADLEVISPKTGSFFFVEAGDGGQPLIYIDGKKASEKKMKALSPDNIDHIEVLKGEKAIEAYGKKAKDGVILITTKK